MAGMKHIARDPKQGKQPRRSETVRALDDRRLSEVRGGIDGGITAQDDWETPVT